MIIKILSIECLEADPKEDLQYQFSPPSKMHLFTAIFACLLTHFTPPFFSLPRCTTSAYNFTTFISLQVLLLFNHSFFLYFDCNSLLSTHAHSTHVHFNSILLHLTRQIHNTPFQISPTLLNFASTPLSPTLLHPNFFTAHSFEEIFLSLSLIQDEQVDTRKSIATIY